MWKSRHAWPVYVTIALSILFWLFVAVPEKVFEHLSIPRNVLDNSFRVITFGWIPFLGIYYLRLNRFKGGKFWALIAIFITAIIYIVLGIFIKINLLNNISHKAFV